MIKSNKNTMEGGSNNAQIIGDVNVIAPELFLALFENIFRDREKNALEMIARYSAKDTASEEERRLLSKLETRSSDTEFWRERAILLATNVVSTYQVYAPLYEKHGFRIDANDLKVGEWDEFLLATKAIVFNHGAPLETSGVLLSMMASILEFKLSWVDAAEAYIAAASILNTYDGWLNAADICLILGDFMQAAAYAKLAVDESKILSAQLSDKTARAYCSFAQAMFGLDRLKHAKYFYEEAVRIDERGSFDNAYVEVDFLNCMGNAYAASGDFQRAIETFEKALECCADKGSLRKPEHAEVLNNLGEVYRQTGEDQLAEERYLAAMEIDKEVLGAEHPDYATDLNNLAVFYIGVDKTVEAMTYAKEALRIRKRSFGENNIYYAHSLHNIGSLSRSTGDLDAAIHYLSSAKAIKEATVGKFHRSYAFSCAELARCLIEKSELNEAQVLFEEAYLILLRVYGMEHFHPVKISGEIEALSKL